MMLERDAIEEVLRRTEQGERRAGWDRPASLWQVRAFGNTVGCLRLPVPVQAPVGDFMVHVAAWMTEDRHGQRLAQTLADPGFAGIVLLHEVWMNDVLRGDDLARRDRPLADIPGSVEARNVACVDTSGRLHMLMRKRGQKLVDFSTLDPRMHLGGRIPTALRDMTLAVARYMPAGTADVDALRTLDVDVNVEAVIEDVAGRQREQDQ